MKKNKKRNITRSLFALSMVLCLTLNAQQKIGDFNSISTGTQGTQFRIADSHEFQFLARESSPTEPINKGYNYPGEFDFTAYVPKSGSSTDGYISLNHELSIGEQEGRNAAVSIIDITLNARKEWIINTTDNVDFSTVISSMGREPEELCAGAVTDWGTVLTCEEVDDGRVIEVDPITKTAVGVYYAMGNYEHENLAIYKDANGNRSFYGGQDRSNAYLFKFIPDTQGDNNSPPDLSSGSLYALRVTGNTGIWLPISEQGKDDNTRNDAELENVLEPPTTFRGIEVVQISPIDGYVYFAIKGSKPGELPNTLNHGTVYRFRDTAPLGGGSTIVDFEIFAGNTNNVGTSVTYNINGTGISYGKGVDNIAFDDEGNLWTLQDGGDNYIWVFGPDHNQDNPNEHDVRIFGQVPAGYEPTGITFTPNYKYLFMSMKSKNAPNTTPACDDLGTCFSMDSRDAAVVIALDADIIEPCALNVTATATNINICESESTTLNATATGGINPTYNWSNGIGGNLPLSITPTETTTYTVTATDVSGCKDIDQVTVNVTPFPEAAISVGNTSQQSVSICSGDSISLKANGGTDYQWSNGATSSSITVSPLVQTNYTVSVSNVTGSNKKCTATEQITISINDNTAPVAVPEVYTLPANGDSIIGDLLNNDSDDDGDNLSIDTIPVTPPTNGTLIINPDGTFIYTSNTGGESDMFEYKVCDDAVCVGAPTLGNFTGQVNSSEDDIEQAEDGGIYTTSSDIELTFDKFDDNFVQIVGTRVAGINIPRDATITNAYLQFVSDNENDAYNTTGSPTFNIQGHDTGNSLTFSTVDNTLTNLPKTTATTVWTPGLWSNDNTTYNTSDISSIIQEITSRADWQSGNAMSFVITAPAGQQVGRRAHAYDGTNPMFAPKLFIDYEISNQTDASLCDITQVVIEDNCIDTNLKVLLEGAYDTTANEMSIQLSTFRKLLPGQTPVSPLATPTPAGQPYNSAPWNYTGTEGAAWTDINYMGDEVDWVLISFRTAMNSNTEVARTAGLLTKDGSVRFVDRCVLDNASPSPLYGIVEHRNHIGVMTPNPIDIINGKWEYDFRMSESYRDPTGFGQKEIGGIWCMYAGDGNQTDFPSYDIQGNDKVIWQIENGKFDKYSPADYNLDGDINGTDKAFWFANNGISSRVPK